MNDPMDLLEVSPQELQQRLPAHVFAALPVNQITAFAVADDLSDTEACCRAYGFRMEDSANAIALAYTASGGGGFALAVLPATRRLDVNHGVRAALQARKVSFAPRDAVAAHLGMEPGGTTPFGLPADWHLLIDSELMTRERIVTGGAIRGIKLLLSPGVLSALPRARVASICKPAGEAP